MSDTEKLLNEAEEMARRSFELPTQETVMRLFSRLCDEHDQKAYAKLEFDAAGETLH